VAAAGVAAAARGEQPIIQGVEKPLSPNPSVREESVDPEGRSITLVFNWNGEQVPAIFLLPNRKEQPMPAALLLHGFNLKKEHMATAIGRELLSKGIASLAIDLPYHGERYTGYFKPPASPFEMMRQWRAAQQECRLALQFLAEHPELDRGRLCIIGYSLGAFLGLKVAADETYLRAFVLAAGGDLPDYIPFAGMVRMLADPVDWVRHLKGRPLLMMHGKQDTIVPPDLAERLFAAAAEPKQFLWFDSGHILPQEAMQHAAQWLVQNL
jgi:fermentation-respiration switch protein FrsA (DUF1100 family)